MLRLYFTTHTREMFVLQFYDLFRISDIVFLERRGSFQNSWDDLLETNLNNVSIGIMTPDTFMKTHVDPESTQYEYQSLLAQTVYRSAKIVRVERSPFSLEEARALFDYTQPRRRNVEEYIAGFDELQRRTAIASERRDRQVVHQLVELLQRFTDKSILVVRGLAHRKGLEKFLTEAGIRNFETTQLLQLALQARHASKIEVGEKPTRRDLLLSLGEFIETKQSNLRIDVLSNRIEQMSNAELESYIAAWWERRTNAS